MTRSTAPWEIKRELLVKTRGTTNLRYGHKPYERPLNEYMQYGIINLDKPAGPTSHEVAAWVKKILRLKHVGHGGTLEA